MSQRERFEKLIEDKLPWGSANRGWTPKNEAAHILWVEFRNPLTYAAGKDKRSKHRPPGFVAPTAGPWGDMTTKRIAAVDARKRWPEKWPVLSVLSDGRGTRHKLTVAALYWAVKRMVLELAQ